MNEAMKDVIWVGDSHARVRSFPQAARTTVGEALRVAQMGGKDINAKPLRGVDSGVFEITAGYDTNTYRAFILSNWVRISSV